MNMPKICIPYRKLTAALCLLLICSLMTGCIGSKPADPTFPSLPVAPTKPSYDGPSGLEITEAQLREAYFATLKSPTMASADELTAVILGRSEAGCIALIYKKGSAADLADVESFGKGVTIDGVRICLPLLHTQWVYAWLNGEFIHLRGKGLEEALNNASVPADLIAATWMDVAITYPQALMRFRIELTRDAMPPACAMPAYEKNADGTYKVVHSDSFASSVLALHSTIENSNVTTIGAGAFQNNKQLVRVLLPDYLSVIEASAFAGCENLIDLIGACMVIGERAFEGCTSLTTLSLSIGTSVCKIQQDAFKGCTALKTIRFYGTVEQWNNIEKYDGWDKDIAKDYQIVCDGGTISAQ